MATPSWKDPKYEEKLDDLTHSPTRREAIDSDMCVSCKGPAAEFDNELSRKEFTISGFCQKCQDVVFRDPENEDDGNRDPSCMEEDIHEGDRIDAAYERMRDAEQREQHSDNE